MLEKSVRCPRVSNVLLQPGAKKMLLFLYCYQCLSEGGQLVKKSHGVAIDM